MKNTDLWKRVVLSFRDKYLALATASLFLSILSYGQKYDQTFARAFGVEVQRLAPKKVLLLPTGCSGPTTSTLTATDSAKKQAAIYYDSCYGRIFIFNPHGATWDTLSTGGGGTGTADSAIFATVTRLADSLINVYAAIATKLNISDTANKWVRKIENNAGGDSIIYWIGSTRYAIKDNGAGGGGTYTAGNGLTLSGSTFKADTSIVSTKNNVLYYYNLLNSGKVNYSDTAGMLANYRHWLVGYLKLSDTGTIATKDYSLSLFDILNASKVAKTLTLTINGTAQDLTTNRTWSVGTVTSVATNAGTGVTGGTITGTGTIALDTTNIVQTRADNTRRLDSTYRAAASLKTGTGNFKDSVANVLDPSYGGGNGSALRLQGAVASGKSVFIPYGTVMNIHDTAITLNDYQKLYGGGEIYSSTVGTVSYAGMYHMLKTGKYNTIDGITFRGAGKGTFITTDYYTPQNGIQILDSANLITNCLFFGIKGAGIIGMDYTGSFANNDNNIINNCRFESNTVGVYNFYGGNYQVITGCTMINNYIGVAQQTANAKIVSSSLNYNHIGLIGEGGPADRAQITGCSLNHNDTALILKNTTYGYLITGTTFFWGDIYLKDADKTTFSNCIIATNAGVKVDGSGIVNKNVQFISCVESNTNTWTEVGTGKIIKVGIMTDNNTRFEVSKTTRLLDTLQLPNIISNQIDTTNLKPAVVDAAGNFKKSFWPTYGGSAVDSFTYATRARVQKAIDSVNAIITANGYMSAYHFIGDGTSGNPIKIDSTHTKVNFSNILGITGTPDGTKFLRDDGSWQAASGSGTPGGSNTQMQYNNVGALAGISGATTDGTKAILTNPSINNVQGQYTTVATAAGTTTLTVTSTQVQNFTGTTTQTVVLPNATTMAAGMGYYISNLSTGQVTVNMNGGTLLKVLEAGTSLAVTVTDISSSAGSWIIEYSGDNMTFKKTFAITQMRL